MEETSRSPPLLQFQSLIILHLPNTCSPSLNSCRSKSRVQSAQNLIRMRETRVLIGIGTSINVDGTNFLQRMRSLSRMRLLGVPLCSLNAPQFWKRSGAWFYRSVPLPGFKMPHAKPKCADDEEQQRGASGSLGSPASVGSNGGTHANLSPVSSVGVPAAGPPANNAAAAAAVASGGGQAVPALNAAAGLLPPAPVMSESDSDDELNATRRRPRHTIRYATTNNSRTCSSLVMCRAQKL